MVYMVPCSHCLTSLRYDTVFNTVTFMPFSEGLDVIFSDIEDDGDRWRWDSPCCEQSYDTVDKRSLEGQLLWSQ